MKQAISHSNSLVRAFAVRYFESENGANLIQLLSEEKDEQVLGEIGLRLSDFSGNEHLLALLEEKLNQKEPLLDYRVLEIILRCLTDMAVHCQTAVKTVFLLQELASSPTSAYGEFGRQLAVRALAEAIFLSSD